MEIRAFKSQPQSGQIKLIALDIDGTLLCHDHTLGECTRRTLQTAHERGIHIVLNSGRMTPSMEFAAKLLGFDVHLIGYNGAQMVAPRAQGRRVLYEQFMYLDVARELLGIASARKLHLNWYLDGVVYSEDLPHLRPHIDLYIRRTGSPYCFVECGGAHLERAPYKVLFIVDPLLRDRLRAELEPQFSPRATITSTDPEYLEFMHPAVNKGLGLQRLAKMLNLNMEQVLAVGDSDNDVPMLRMAGWGVGVANARAKVRAVADALTPSDCNHDGVAEAVERWALGP